VTYHTYVHTVRMYQENVRCCCCCKDSQSDEVENKSWIPSRTSPWLLITASLQTDRDVASLRYLSQSDL